MIINNHDRYRAIQSMGSLHISLPSPNAIPTMHQLLKPEDLATIINVSSRTILNWYYDGIIPARVHVGKVIRFELEPVMAALDKVREPPRADEFFRRRRPTKRTR